MSVVLRGVAHPCGGCADAETVAEDGAWCAPASTADLLGLGAHAPWICSQVEADLAASVPIAAGEPHSRPRAVVCFPRPELAGKAGGQSFRISFAVFVFSRCAQDTTTSSTRRCSTPTASNAWPPFSSRRVRRRTPSARTITAGRGRGCRCAGGQEDARLAHAEAAEPERTAEATTIGYTVCTSLVYDREIARVCAHDGSGRSFQ